MLAFSAVSGTAYATDFTAGDGCALRMATSRPHAVRVRLFNHDEPFRAFFAIQTAFTDFAGITVVTAVSFPDDALSDGRIVHGPFSTVLLLDQDAALQVF